MKRLWFYIKLYPYFVSRSIQARMSYKGDFILGVVAAIMVQALGFIFMWTIFYNVPEVNGWNFNQMVFIYGMSAIALGMNEFLFAGTWSVTKYVQEGELDRLLLRPVSSMFSILAADVSLHGIGSALAGVVMCVISAISLDIAWSITLIAFWLLAGICGTLIYFAMNMLMATLAFWVVDSKSSMMLLQNTFDFSKYPATSYGKTLRIIVSYVIPVAFSSYYPATFLLGMSSQPIYWLGPVVAAVLCVIVSVLFWRFALGRYQSAGG